MRLSSRLSDKSKNTGEIESFIDWEKYTISPEEETEEVHLISAGDFLEIQIGTILLPFYSTACEDSVTFVSPQELHCLIINKQMISIDAFVAKLVRSAADEAAQHTFRTADARCKFCLRNFMRFH